MFSWKREVIKTIFEMVLTNQDLLLKLSSIMKPSSIIAFLHNIGKQTLGLNFWYIPGFKRIRWKMHTMRKKSLKSTKHTALYLEHCFHRMDEKLPQCYFIQKKIKSKDLHWFFWLILTLNLVWFWLDRVNFVVYFQVVRYLYSV